MRFNSSVSSPTLAEVYGLNMSQVGQKSPRFAATHYSDTLSWLSFTVRCLFISDRCRLIFDFSKPSQWRLACSAGFWTLHDGPAGVSSRGPFVLHLGAVPRRACRASGLNGSRGMQMSFTPWLRRPPFAWVLTHGRTSLLRYTPLALSTLTATTRTPTHRQGTPTRQLSRGSLRCLTACWLGLWLLTRRGLSCSERPGLATGSLSRGALQEGAFLTSTPRQRLMHSRSSSVSPTDTLELCDGRFGL